MMPSIYAEMDSRILEATKSDVGFTMKIANVPKIIEEKSYSDYKSRYSIITEYLSGVINVYRQAVLGELPFKILQMLFGDCPISIGLKFHTELSENIVGIPVFFRTDEATPGKILEVQCPGSQWGDYQVVVDTLSENGYGWLGNYSLANKFTEQLTNFLGQQPIIHHLLDNSSIPHTMLYFVHRTRPKSQYFSLDKGVRPLNCNFVRSHSVYGLVAENFFRHRIELANENKLHFDLPPFIPFDEKVSLALPFMDETKSCFSQNVRNTFAFTTPILEDAIRLEDGFVETIESFSRKSRQERNFYLKYAGSDVSVNWGSRGVYRLSNDSQENCYARLAGALKDYKERGRCWVLQKEEKCYENVEWNERDGSTHQAELSTNYKGFYGPSGLLGVMTMHRNHYKVHGQEDTIISICSPQPEV